MKTLAKKIAVIIMALAIVTSTISGPQKVKAADFYVITFNANGGYFSKVSSNVRSVKMPSTVGLKATSYYSPDSRTNYSFLGWSTSNTAKTATYAVNSTLPRKKATYYAVWRSLATTGVKINQANVTIKMGTIQKLTATVLPSYAANKSVKWTSSNTNVLKVASDGTITPVRPGTATVTVTTVSGGYKASTTVSVIQGVDVSVDVTKKCETKQTIKYSIKSTGTTDEDKIVGYYYDGEYTSITPTHATIVEKEVSTATTHIFMAMAANGAKNYASALPFYNVTFNSNDGKSLKKTCLFSAGTKPSINDTKNIFKREGYCLAGWSTDPYANEPDEVYVRGNDEYYAVWYKVKISDDPNNILKDSIDVKYSYDPTQIYINVIAPDGSVVNYDTSWKTIKDIGSISSYKLENGNLLYTTMYSGSKLTVKSADGLLEGTVKVNLYKNITVTRENIINEDGTCTLVFYAHFKESSLKSFSIDGVKYSASDVADYDKSINTYRIETVVNSNGVKRLEILGEDNSYISIGEYINIFKENYGITTESTLLDKNGAPAATVKLKCGLIEDNPKGYYFGTSMDYNENEFYSLEATTNDNDIDIFDNYYDISHYIREAGTYYYTPVDADGISQNTYEMTVCEIKLDTNSGNPLDKNRYYVFQNKMIELSKLPVPTNAKKNQIFRGWYSADGAYKNVKITDDIVLKAKWRTNPFKDVNGKDTGFSFSFEQFKFGFCNFGCTKSPNGHCRAMATLACQLVTSENEFDVSDFQKVEEDGTLTTINTISEFKNITGSNTDTVYINSKTGISLNEYLCAYQHGASGITRPKSTNYDGAKNVLKAAQNIKNTGVPIQVSVDGIISSGSDVVSMGHALVAYDVKQVKATSGYTEYSLFIYDCNDNKKERTLSIWCYGDEESSDAEWGWKYVWNETNILGSDYSQSSLDAEVYDCNN